MFIMRRGGGDKRKKEEPKGLVHRHEEESKIGNGDEEMKDSARLSESREASEQAQREKEEKREQRRLEKLIDLSHELSLRPNTFKGKAQAYFFFGAKACRKLVNTKNFQNFITLAIVIASVMVGLQTYEKYEENQVLATMDTIILGIFTAECILKIYAAFPKWWTYFNDRWNQFDFLVVFICYMPVDASMVTVLRLARLLRVLKLVRALPELQVLVMGLLSSLSSIFYVAMLLMLVFYLYAVLCVTIFRDNDPVHFANLEITFLTLFRMATFEDWTDVMYTQMFGCDIYHLPFRQHLCTSPKAFGWWPAVMFISFLVLSSFVVLNLFIGVITSNMQDARDQLKQGGDEEEEEEDVDEDEAMCEMINQRLKLLSETIGELQGELGSLEKEVTAVVKSLKVNKQHSEVLKKKLEKRPSFFNKLLSGGDQVTTTEDEPEPVNPSMYHDEGTPSKSNSVNFSNNNNNSSDSPPSSSSNNNNATSNPEA